MGKRRDRWKRRRRRQAARAGSPCSSRDEPDNGMAAILRPLHPLNPLSPLYLANLEWPDDEPPADSMMSRDPPYGTHHDPATHHTDSGSTGHHTDGGVSNHHDSGAGHSGHSEGVVKPPSATAPPRRRNRQDRSQSRAPIVRAVGRREGWRRCRRRDPTPWHPIPAWPV